MCGPKMVPRWSSAPHNFACYCQYPLYLLLTILYYASNLLVPFFVPDGKGTSSVMITYLKNATFGSFQIFKGKRAPPQDQGKTSTPQDQGNRKKSHRALY